MQALGAWLEGNAIFLALLVLLAVFQHAFALVQVAFLVTSTASSTMHLQALVAAPPERKLLKAVDVLVIVSLNIWALTLLNLPDATVLRVTRLRAPTAPLTVRPPSLSLIHI